MDDAKLPTCQICGYTPSSPDPRSFGIIRGNTERFRGTNFKVWKCPKCLTVYSLDPVNFSEIYSDYPLNRRKLDVFARGTSRNLLRRLTRAGLKKDDRILDYGCGSGVFLQYLKQRGYGNCFGYDPYVLEFKRLPAEMGPFDCVVNNDTIEHCDDVRAMLRQCIELLKPGGLLYVGTSDSEPVNMQCLEPEIMRFHQPFHRIMLTQKSLRGLVGECGLELIRSYRRSYHDTLNPFVNYRFLDELNKAVGHNLDRALDPTVGSVVSRSPRLWFYGLFGYLFPTAYEPAVIARKPETVWRGTGS